MKQLQTTVTLIGLQFILFAYNHCVCTLNKLMCANTGLGVAGSLVLCLLSHPQSLIWDAVFMH